MFVYLHVYVTINLHQKTMNMQIIEILTSSGIFRLNIICQSGLAEKHKFWHHTYSFQS